MKNLYQMLCLMVLILLPMQLHAKQSTGDFTVGNKTFLLNGEPFVIKAAELHYPRIPYEYWEHRIEMCKSLGMNTICIYLFWNIHEPIEDHFDFSGNNDVAAFCRLVQKHGMYVIVRPGPYVCAEWEMGGLPWWLLKKKDIRLRECDPYFLERVDIYMKEVGKQLAGMTIQNGGNIIMVQVENEYGSYGEDKEYVGKIRDMVRDAGFGKVALFQCDWASNFTKNGLDDLVWTMNFGAGANIDQQFALLQELRPESPLMCSEYWSGWFDKWGASHEERSTVTMVEGIDEMLSKGISFSLYMTHGGTSFGHWAGANSPGFAPDVTSYDYDAPINEYGMPTDKYYMLRETLQKYNGKRLPAIPKMPMPVVTVPEFVLSEYAPLKNGIDTIIKSKDTKTFEDVNLGWGTAVYSVLLPQTTTIGTITADIHDYAQYFINGKYIGTTDRVKNEKSIVIPPVSEGDTLQIVVEAMGRINFGRAIKDFKGIVGNVELSSVVNGHDVLWNLKNWNIATISDDYQTAVKAFEKGEQSGKRGYYRGHFNLKKVGDTFLNFETWGKGQVWVNGHAVGRIWCIGPQQTLYVPGCWLKKGENEVIVLDVVGANENVVWGEVNPILDKLQLKENCKHSNIEDKPDLNTIIPVAEGTFEKGNGWQILHFNKSQVGRYVAIECISTHSDNNQVAIAEIYLQDSDAKRLSRELWKVKYADSEQENGNHYGNKVFDLQESTYWMTEENVDLPHLLVIDLGCIHTVSSLEYLPRAEEDAPGAVKEYKIYVY